MQKSFSDITSSELEEIKKLAALFFTPREIAIILEKEIDFFIYDCEIQTTISIAFQSGRLLAETELRASIMKLAKSGSSPAQTMALEMLRNSKMKMLDK